MNEQLEKGDLNKMSLENAQLFLEDAAQSEDLRGKFTGAANPEEFIKIATDLGYNFTAEELKTAVSQLSEGIKVRRKTGVWPWLRTVQWMHSSMRE